MLKKVFQTETQNSDDPSAQKAQRPYCSWRLKPPNLPTYLPTIARENLACIALLETGPKGPVSSNRSFKFSQNWLSNMTSRILLDEQVFCQTNFADLAIFKPL